MTQWQPIKRRGSALVASAEHDYATTPFGIEIEVPWPDGDATGTVALVRRHWSTGKGRESGVYQPAGLVLARLRKGDDGWEWLVLGETPVRPETANPKHRKKRKA